MQQFDSVCARARGLKGDSVPVSQTVTMPSGRAPQPLPTLAPASVPPTSGKPERLFELGAAPRERKETMIRGVLCLWPMLLLLLLLTLTVAMPVTTVEVEPRDTALASPPATNYPDSSSSSVASALSTDESALNRTCYWGCLEKCLRHCDELYIKAGRSKITAGRCVVHVSLHQMVRNDSIVTANISWATVYKKQFVIAPTQEVCPEDEVAAAGSQCLVSWDVSSGGLTGHLFTESSGVQLSLWPETSYSVQISCLSKRTNLMVKSPILKLNTSIAAATVAEAVTWQPPTPRELIVSDEDGGIWQDGFRNYTNQPENDKVARNTAKGIALFVGMLIFGFILFLAMLMLAASPKTATEQGGAPRHPETNAMMGNDAPMVEIQHV